MNPNFEILAPAGSYETLRAVIDAGADAVYLGGAKFGARAYANNFTEEEMLEAIDYAHLRGAKVYLTVNTLLKNQEMEQLYEYLLPYYKQGLDAVLVQDFGALMNIHSWFPDLPVHTSTQMTITGTEGVNLLREYGVTRVVMAREMSIPEMKRIHEETGMELEAFVHGALCYSYSGQCLFSSLLGGRSGNRGRCAQPCRLPYSVLDAQKKCIKKDSYILSLKDLCGISHLKELEAAGVYSLKIEGRMKKSSYAFSVVSMYRKYVDLLAKDKESTISDADAQELYQYGNRCGFTDTYLHRHNGEDMVTYSKPSFQSEKEALHVPAPKISIHGKTQLRIGQPAILTLYHPSLSEEVTVMGTEVMAAEKKPLIPDEIVQRLSKTGDTAFAMDSMKVEADEGIFIPNGALNQLRRDGISALEEAVLSHYHRACQGDETENANNVVKDSRNCIQDIPQCFTADVPAFEKLPSNLVQVQNRAQLSVILSYPFAQGIFLSHTCYGHKTMTEQLAEDVKRIKAAGKKAYFVMPGIFRSTTSAFYREVIPALRNISLDGYVVRNLEEIGFLREEMGDVCLIADHNLYTYNDTAKKTLRKWGITFDTVPYELNRTEILGRDLSDSIMCLYGYYPLMTTAGCVHRNAAGCDKKPTLHFLSDRYHAQFPVQNDCNECMNTIYNSLPTMLFSARKELMAQGLDHFLLCFHIESEEEIRKICDVYEAYLQGDGMPPKDCNMKFTNGHYKRGVL